MFRLMCVAAVLLLLSVSLSSVNAAPAGDLVDSLPGYGKTKSAQYSGLIAVDEAATGFLHYWFVAASAVEPSTAPLSIWLNGGPGCSSLDGFLYENGPFTFRGDVDDDGIPVLMDNPMAWSTISNMLWIESPFGVGYSYATNGSTQSNDDTTSQNMHGFLINWYTLTQQQQQQQAADMQCKTASADSPLPAVCQVRGLP
jgi:serine carboxypeptidase-like clade 1